MPHALAGRLLRRLGLALPIVFIAAGCLKSLDESLINAKDAGAKDAGGHDGGGTGGKDSGTGGTDGGGTDGGGTDGGGTDGGGTDGGGTDGGGTGGSDAGDGGVVPYDPSKFPVTPLTTAVAPVVMATDDTDVFHTVDNGINQPLNRISLGGGAVTTLGNLERPHALAAPPTSGYVYSGGGQDSGNGGTLLRSDKVGGSPESITTATGSMGPAIGVYASSDGYAYVSFQADPSLHKPALARFPLAQGSNSATVLYNAATDESGGPVATAGGCVYWISSGHIFTMLSGGAPDRSSALANQVSNAVGLAADASRIYYTLSTGSVWTRQVVGACDGSGASETELTQGFTGLGPVIAFRSAPIIAFAALGNQSATFAGGGIFAMPSGGGQVTQIAPHTDGPTTLIDGPTDVVYAVTTGDIRKVPKP